MPDAFGHVLECLLEPLRLILRLDTQSGNVFDLADENQFDPAREGAIAVMLLLVSSDVSSVMCVHLHGAVRFRIGLGAVADADDLLLGQPAVKLLHAFHLVFFCAQRKIRK